MIPPLDLPMEVMQTPLHLLPQKHMSILERRPGVAHLDPKVLVPYTQVYPEVKEALAAAHIDPIWVPCSNDDDYYWYFKEMWDLGETFTVNEHDIVAKPGDLEELLACPEPWCGRPYPIGTCYQACLGFTKFDKRLMLEHPQALRWVGELDVADDGAAQRIWNRLDTRIFQFLNNHGFSIHTHWPPICHVKESQFIAVEIERGWCHWPPRTHPD